MRRPALIVSFMIVALASASAQSLYGRLKPGPHAVGYRALPLVDTTRAPIGDLTRGIKPFGPGRAISAHIWYPAHPDTGIDLTYGRYIDALRDIVGADRNPKARTADELFSEQVADLSRGETNIQGELPRLRKLPVWARERAIAKEGKFPLVLHPDYRAPALNNVLCEYLASHGFVVVTLAMTGSRDLPFNVGRAGIVTLAEDVLFVRSALRRFHYVDANNSAVIGVGISASSNLIAAMRQPAIRALVSLDGGIPTQFEDTLLKQIPDYDITLFRIPMLVIMQEDHPSVDSVFLDQYKYSDRYLRDFKKMSEFYFINFGNLETLVPGIIGKPPGDTAAGFAQAADYIRDFLQSTLKRDSAARQGLTAAPESRGILAGDVIARDLSALPEPLSYHEIRAMIGRDGFDAFKSWYTRSRQRDPQPIANQTASELFSWLSYTGDTDGTKRLELAKMRVEMYPQSARAHFTLAQHLKNLKIAGARDHYERALTLLPGDADPMIDSPLRKRIEELAKKELAGN
jgi:hypothetical protein